MAMLCQRMEDPQILTSLVSMLSCLDLGIIWKFHGHCGYYRRFIYNHKPLYGLLVLFVWTKECEELFAKLKHALSLASILKASDWNLIFHVHVDAQFCNWSYISPTGEDKMDSPISYAIKQLNSAERNYITTK